MHTHPGVNSPKVCCCFVCHSHNLLYCQVDCLPLLKCHLWLDFFVLHMHSFLQVLKLCLTCSGGVVVVVGPPMYPLKCVHYATLIVCSVLQSFFYFFLRQSIFNVIIHCLSTFRRHSTDDQDLDLISNTSGSYKRDNFIFRIWNFKRKVSQNIVHCFEVIFTTSD